MWYTAGEILLWILLGALLAGIVGYLLRRSGGGVDVAEHDAVVNERASFAAKATSLEKDRDEYVSAHAKLRDDLERSRVTVGERDSEIATLTARLAAPTDDGSGRIAELEAELDACRAARAELQAEIETARVMVSDAETRIATLTTLPPEPELDLDAASAIIGERVELNDLKLVEGIGPKIAELCNDAGITTWRQLSNTSVDRLREILGAAGERFRVHDPGTWPFQSRLLADGHWHEFKSLIDRLDAGREPGA
jgi:predicted flap endonuclease-1-like 5' DNA nuclease